jgi:hypothetical protein
MSFLRGDIGARMAVLREPSSLRLMAGEITSGEVKKVYAAFDVVDAAVEAGRDRKDALNDLLQGGRLKKTLGTLSAQEDRTVRAVLRALAG